MSLPPHDPDSVIAPAEAAHKLRLLLSQVEQTIPTSELPPPTPYRGHKKLTVGMATYDDFDGVYFTVQALRLYHPEVQDDLEILVLDNHPEGSAAPALKSLEYWIPNYRYVPYRAWRGTAARDLIFREANADYVLCLDAHVLLAPGALRQLLQYFDAHPDTRDLLQGPLVYDDLTTLSTHFEPGWRDGMYGTWGTDERGVDPTSEPFEIPMQGLGVFACRRAAWPGLNPRLRGFGAEEGYLHEKIRRAGGRTLCLPFLRWVHRFGRPSGIPYRPIAEDRVRNYLLTLRELGLDPSEAEAHLKEWLGPAGERVISQANAQLDNPFLFFDAVYCINLPEATERWTDMTRRFQRLGIDWLVRRFEGVKTPESHHLGCTLSHRRIVAEAKQQGLEQVLVLEDDAIFHVNTLDVLRHAMAELAGQSWRLFYLGGHPWGQSFSLAPGCAYLERPTRLTTTHAVAYHHSVYDVLLADIPDNTEALKEWVKDNAAIDQYLLRHQAHSFVVRPVLATQPSLLPVEDPAQRDNFFI